MPLSPTQLKVLALKDQGKSYKEISTELDISENTVRTHVHEILVRTMANCMTQAAFRVGGKRIIS